MTQEQETVTLDDNFYACTHLVKVFSFNVAESEDTYGVYSQCTYFRNEIDALWKQKKIDFETYNCCYNAMVEISDEKMRKLLNQ